MALGASVVGLLFLYNLPLDLRDRSPQQPLAFSHKLHATDYGIPCLYCHRNAPTASVAGLPAMTDCLACHLHIAPDSPEIKKLTAYWEKQEAIPWIRVYSLPDHVYFSHMQHLRAQLACTTCHSEVAAMERIERQIDPEMGWCLNCHRQQHASIECWTCHL